MEAMVGPGLTRRQVIAAVAMAGAAAAVPALRRVALPTVLRSEGDDVGASPDRLTLARFIPHVGTRFTAQDAGMGTLHLTLDEATAIVSSPADQRGLRGDAFSLILSSPGRPSVGDGIHTLVHPALGTFPLFLVAVGRGAGRQDYQAVVDRRVTQAR